MAIVLDYTRRINPIALKNGGVVGVCRYVSLPLASTAWKRITLDEYNELITNGFDVTLNFEYDARDWLGGATAGGFHARTAVNTANALRYPAGKVIVGSADFDMTRAQWDSVGQAYASTFATVIRDAGYRPGVYGPWDVLEWCKGIGYDAFWQAGMSTAWSGRRNANAWPGAHFRQRGHLKVGGVDADWNDILIQPLWGFSKGFDMKSAIIYRDPRSGACIVRDGMLYYGIPDGGQLSAIQSLIAVAGGDITPRDVAPNAWDMITASGVSVADVRVRNSSGWVTVTVTQEQLTEAVTANVPAIVTLLASHFKVV